MLLPDTEAVEAALPAALREALPPSPPLAAAEEAAASALALALALALLESRASRILTPLGLKLKACLRLMLRKLTRCSMPQLLQSCRGSAGAASFCSAEEELGPAEPAPAPAGSWLLNTEKQGRPNKSSLSFIFKYGDDVAVCALCAWPRRGISGTGGPTAASTPRAHADILNFIVELISILHLFTLHLLC